MFQLNFIVNLFLALKFNFYYPSTFINPIIIGFSNLIQWIWIRLNLIFLFSFFTIILDHSKVIKFNLTLKKFIFLNH